jgi:hypothetical protein
LTQRTWQLARGGGLTSGAAPDPLPIDPRVVAAIAPPPKLAPGPGTPEGDGGLTFGPIASGASSLVAFRAADGDADKVATQIAVLAGVFDRASFKITAKGGEKAARAIATAAAAHGVPLARLGVAAADPGIFANVEIMAPP